MFSFMIPCKWQKSVRETCFKEANEKNSNSLGGMKMMYKMDKDGNLGLRCLDFFKGAFGKVIMEM